MRSGHTMNSADAGENLVNFINSVSSCVKTVLSKPGCFKRNTNHRRFLQKQLRQSVQDKNDSESLAPPPKDLLRKQSNETAVNLTVNGNLTSEAPESPKSDNGGNTNNIAAPPPNTKKIWKQKTIRKKRRYNPIHNSPPPPAQQMPQQPPRPSNPLLHSHQLSMPPPLLIPSPTADYPTNLFGEQYVMDMTSADEHFFKYTTDNIQHCLFPPIPTNAYFNNNHGTPMFSLPFSRKSISTAGGTFVTTGEEGFGLGDFLSGEDLMRNLNFGDLFIPDCSSGDDVICENKLSYKTYVETEKQIQYLAQLEALEACYQAKEQDLILSNLIPDL